jgi:hypothetical protein
MRKNLKITEDAHRIIKDFCEANHLKMSDWASSVLLKEITEIADVHLQNNEHSKQ